MSEPKELPIEKNQDHGVFGSQDASQGFHDKKVGHDLDLGNTPQREITEDEIDVDFHAHRNLDVDASGLPEPDWLKDKMSGDSDN